MQNKPYFASPRPKKIYYEDNDIKYLNKDELKRLFQYLKERDKYYLLMCLFLYETATRYSEAAAAKFKDIEESSNKVKLLNKKQKKKSFKIVIISPDLKLLILEHYLRLKERDHSLTRNNYIFIKRPGAKTPTHQGVDKQLKLYFREALGQDYLDRAHTHVFRHSKAISLLESSSNLMQVKLLLGHKSIANTIVYLRYSNPDLFRALENDHSNFFEDFSL